MNDIKENLEIMQLDEVEFFEHTLEIVKRNWKNFLFSIIFLTVLNVIYFYRRELADKISSSRVGDTLYNFSKQFNFSSFFDDGNQEYMRLGLYLRMVEIIKMLISFLEGVLISGLIISVSYYIDKNKKENSFIRILKSFFRIIVPLFLAGLLGIVSGFIYLLPINEKILDLILIIGMLYIFLKGRYFPIEFLYKKNNVFKSLENSFSYSKNSNMTWFFSCLILFFMKIGIIYLLQLAGKYEIFITIIKMLFDVAVAIIITLSYFNEKYLRERIRE